MATYYLWLKAIHVAFMVTWFAGLFYLPRLFIYHAEAGDDTSHERFTVMQRRLFAITLIGGVLTVLFGAILLHLNAGLGRAGWLHVKLLLVAGLVFYQYRCWRWIVQLRDKRFPENTRWLRWFNEIPALLLFVIVVLAVVKPL